MTLQILSTRSDALAEAAAQAWARLDGNRARPVAIERLQKKRKGIVYRLRGSGPGGTSVVAKRSTAERIIAERAIYEQILASLPISRVQYYGFVEEADGGWIFLEDAGDDAYLPRREEHRELAARWLGLLHSAAARTESAVCSGAQRDRTTGFYREQLRMGRGMLLTHSSNPSLSNEHVRLISDVMRQCEAIDAHWSDVEKWCSALPPTFVHGDFAPKNMRVREGTLLPFDWGSAGWGSVAADLAQKGNTSGEYWDYWADPDLATYAATVQEHGTRISADQVRMLAIAGKLFRCLVCINLEAPSFACEWVENAARDMYVYRTAIADAISSAGWTVPKS
jgi:hypothetical protein